MDFVPVAIASAIVLGHPVQQKSRILIGLNCILLCLNNSSQITKMLQFLETPGRRTYLNYQRQKPPALLY